MGKIEEGGANVGSMHPVTPIDGVLSKTMTSESVDAEFNALQLKDTEKPVEDPDQIPELPSGILPAEDPMNPVPENLDERPATPEEIQSIKDLEAEMEAYFGENIGDNELFTEGVHDDMSREWKKYFSDYNKSIKETKRFIKQKKYDQAISSAKNAISAMTTCKNKLQKIHPDVLQSILGWFLRNIILTFEYILASIVTLGLGSFIMTIKETLTVITGIYETYKKEGFSIEMIDLYKQNLVGSATLLISYAKNILEKVKDLKDSEFDESADKEITGTEYLYLEEAMKDIEHLCRISGIVTPDLSVKDSEDLFVFEGYDEDSSNDSSFFEDGDKSIDEDIKPIIKKLNEKGYKTISSCSGHPSARSKDDRFRDGVKYKKLYSTARVVFDKIYDFPSIPTGWSKKVMEEDQRVGIYVDPPEFKIINGLPEKQYANWKKRYMRSLEKWADELPNEGDTKESETSDVSLESVVEDVVLNAMVGV